MRDPKRIRPLLDRLEAVWTQYPDIRLGQMVVVASPADVFSVEDDRLIVRIEQLAALIALTGDVK